MALNRSRLGEVLAVFGRLGCTAFGGPAAHVAMQETECVRRRGWLDHRRFLDFLAATNLVPGPNSTEMAMHLGRLRAGWPGLVAGGVAFIAPSAVLVTLLAAAYARGGELAAVETVLATLRPAVLAVAAALAGLGEIGIVLVAAALGTIAGATRPARVHAVPLLELAAVCLKIGATLFGSGYVLVAYLRAEVVVRGWITDRQLLDAIAIGQVTPGPVSTAATFVGYLVAGVPGAIVATVGIFLPAFVLVGATGPYVERLRQRPALAVALDWVGAAVVGLIAAVIVRLEPQAIVDGPTFAVALAAAAGRFVVGLGPSTVLVAALAAGVLRALA